MARFAHLLDKPPATSNGHRDLTDEDEFLDAVESEMRIAARYANAVEALGQLSEITGELDVSLLKQWARPHVEAVAKLVADRQVALKRPGPVTQPPPAKA